MPNLAEKAELLITLKSLCETIADQVRVTEQLNVANLTSRHDLSYRNHHCRLGCKN